MALSIEQIVAYSYEAVLAEMRKGTNQWVENAALRELQKGGFIKHVSLGPTIECPLDYRPNPDAGILVTDMDSAPLTKTEIGTAASYEIAQLSVPVTWSKGDDAKNPEENQKVNLATQILENGINTHDDIIERNIFVTSTAGGVELNGLDVLVPDSGQGTPGGISAVTETWWRNFADTYTDVTDIEATMTAAYNAAMKGSGSEQTPKILLGGSDPHALYESQLQQLQRFVDTNEADGGFKVLAFKTARFVFSQYGDDHVYFLNPKSYNLVVSKQYFRDKGNTQEINDANAFRFFIYSALQAITNNKSRLAVISLA